MKKILFLGSGNITKSLIAGLYNDKNYFDNYSIFIFDRNIEKMESLKKKYKVNIILKNNIKKIINNMEIIILSVKPQDIDNILLMIKQNIIKKDVFLLSVAAGITIKYIHEKLNKIIKINNIIRMMPNTACSINKGVIAFYKNENLSLNINIKTIINNIFNNLGTIIWLKKENELHLITALSGSGIAYFYYFINLINDVSLNLGLDKKYSKEIVISVASGAVNMLIKNENKSINELIDHIKSPGGTTESALDVFDNSSIKNIIKSAISSAVNKSKIFSN